MKKNMQKNTYTYTSKKIAYWQIAYWLISI